MKNVILFSLIYCMIYHISNVFGGIHVVLNTNDSGIGSLRQAIIDANIDPDPTKTISFSIASGIQTIQPLTAFPALVSSNIVIDGSTQPGWSDNNPMIIIDGSLLPKFTTHAFTLRANNCTIQNLVINNGFFAGVALVGDSDSNAIYRCFIGTDQLGAVSVPNAFGIYCYSHPLYQNTNVIIGAPNMGNIISGNAYCGIVLSGKMNQTLIQSNMIGTAKDGISGLPNRVTGIGITPGYISAGIVVNNTIIGGENINEGNIIFPGMVGTVYLTLQYIDNTIISGNSFIPNTSFRLNSFGISIFHHDNISIGTLIIENNTVL